MRTRTERQTQRQSEAAGNPLNEMRTTRKNKRKKKNRSKSGETKAEKPARTWNVSERNHAAFVRLFNRNSSMRTHREISRQRATGRRRQTSTQQEAGRTTVIYLSIYLSLSRCRNLPSALSPADCLGTCAVWRPDGSFRCTACWAQAARCPAAAARPGSSPSR